MSATSEKNLGGEGEEKKVISFNICRVSGQYEFSDAE